MVLGKGWHFANQGSAQSVEACLWFKGEDVVGSGVYVGELELLSY